MMGRVEMGPGSHAACASAPHTRHGRNAMNTHMKTVAGFVTALVLVVSVVLGITGCGAAGSGEAQQVRVVVTEAGFVPPRVEVKRGRPVVVTFSRATEQTCGTDVVFASLKRGYDLPLNKDVRVELAAAEIGDTLKYSCSMEMLHGMLVAK